jgi:hypothetical protein
MLRSRVVINLLIIAASVMAGPAVKAGIRFDQAGYTTVFVGQKDGSYVGLFIWAVNHDVAPGGLFSIVPARCSDPRPTTCKLQRKRAVSGQVREGEVLDFAPDLSFARLKVTRRGITHEISWTAVGDPSAVNSSPECSAPAGKGLGMARRAAVAGNVFGHSFSKQHSEQRHTSLEAVAYTC